MRNKAGIDIIEIIRRISLSPVGQLSAKITRMSYRRNDPSWNILLFGVLLLGGCDGGKAPAPAGGAAPALASTLRFDPEKEDHSDLAVGETVVERIALRSKTPSDWKSIELATSCDCLDARFVDTSDPKRAVVELKFHSDKVEEIDGVVYARGGGAKDETKEKDVIAKDGHGEIQAIYTATIVARRVPFVTPRSVVLEKGGSGRFDLVVGQAFAKDAKPPVAIDADVHCDEAKLALVDYKPVDGDFTEEHTLLRTRVTLELQEAARAAAFTTKVTLKFGVPAVERTVEVQWK
jgi:hypothetical protein